MAKTQITDTPLFKACLFLQSNIDDLDIAPIKQQNRPGALFSFMSPENRRGVRLQEQVRTLDGKVQPKEASCAKIEVSYTPKDCDGEVLDCCPLDEEGNPVEGFSLSICGNENHTPPKQNYFTVSVDKCKYRQGYFTKADFACLCTGKDPNGHLTDVLREAAEAILIEMNKDVLCELYLNAGLYSDGSSSMAEPKELPIITIDQNGKVCLQDAAQAYMEQELENNCNTADKIVIGGTYLSLYDKLQNTSAGQGGARAWNFTHDKYLDKVVSEKLAPGSYGFCVARQAFQVLEWYENVGTCEEQGESHRFTTLTFFGVRFDFYLKYEACDRKWYWTLAKRYDTCCLPEDAYCWNSGNKLLYQFGCGPWSCDIFKCLAPQA